MSGLDKKSLVNILCPYCNISFKKNLEYKKEGVLSAVLIKNHSGENCPSFIAFIDSNGKHRGSQKIDKIEEDIPINENLIEYARNKINELRETLRFYHLKVARKDGRGFEHKVANVADRSFMSSPFYVKLIQFLVENQENNIFGAVNIEKNADFEGGILVYGKYLGVIFTIFWKEQKHLQSKTLDDLKGYANLTVEKLLDIYNITEILS